MTWKEINTLVESIATALEIPSAYYVFATPQEPPYLVWMLERNDFYADDSNYKKIARVSIELYTDNKEPGMEATIESLLPFSYTYGSSYIDSEKMYQTTYDFETTFESEEIVDAE